MLESQKKKITIPLGLSLPLRDYLACCLWCCLFNKAGGDRGCEFQTTMAKFELISFKPDLLEMADFDKAPER